VPAGRGSGSGIGTGVGVREGVDRHDRHHRERDEQGDVPDALSEALPEASRFVTGCGLHRTPLLHNAPLDRPLRPGSCSRAPEMLLNGLP
jgi:hypothetical protein